ncbi:hypothetical protein GCM10009127_20750 [Alteraurantiacibacter aestuarii]|uniref:peptidylprolyl isomerase n=1 Tax=Alteraurantiacibacter aestuarii TaxID=650004 RepID=UPI0031D1A7EF
MLQFFRNFFKSKVGIIVTLAFLALIAVAFASSDVANNSTFGGVTGGDRVAVVGDKRINTSDLAELANNALQRMRQENPTMTMEGFVASGGLADALGNIISRSAIAELGREYGLRAGPRLVDSEIVKSTDFRAIDGSFDINAFRAALRQQGLNEDTVRDDLAMGLFARQLVTPIMAAPQMPLSVAKRYAQLRLETRTGAVGAILAGAYAPKGDPSTEQLQAFYNANRTDYIRPERRVVRYASFGEEALNNLPQPTDAQIAERYEADNALYAEQETRRFTQLIAPTQAAAQAIVNEVNGGRALEVSAREKGLSTSQIAATTREDFAGVTSAAVAAAGFTARNGSLSAPAQGSLGWYILRVDSVDRRAGRSLAQVRAEISATLANEQRREALNETTARIEEEFSNGRSLSEVAQELGLELTSTPPITAAGQVYGTQESAPQELARIIPVAFEMTEADPQLAETVPGQVFMIYDVAQITRSATAPLADIREQVVSAWRVDEGMKAAGEAATRVLARVEGGATLAAAIRAEEVSLPAPESLTLSRAEVEQSGRLPPAIALFFSMAQGTAKRLESPQTLGWFVVQLTDISAPDVADDDPIVASTQSQLVPFLVDEYSLQFVNAAENSVDVEINQVAVDAVAAQLTGQTN